MRRFIEVTGEYGDSMLINLDHVTHIIKLNNGAVGVCMHKGIIIEINETISDIRSQLATEITRIY